MTPLELDHVFNLGPQGYVRSQRRKILFIQTDWEMGMARVARDLIASGHEVTKVALNFSDYFYKIKRVPSIPFKEPISAFREWLVTLFDEQEIDTIFVYNSTRPYNEIACQLAQEKGIGIVQMEQGLLRPLHVSAYFGSEIPIKPIQRLWEEHRGKNRWPAPGNSMPDKRISTVYKTFLMIVSFLTALLFASKFPHYRDQRTMSFTRHFGPFLWSAWRLLLRSGEPFLLGPKISGSWSGRFFLVPLQLDHDAQIVFRSPFNNVGEMLDQVADSFAEHADEDDFLILKIHPLDRGYHTYKGKVEEIKKKVGKDRVILVDRICLDLLLQHAKGVVTINSTVGLTALRHLKPVKVLGEAIYDLEDLTYRSSLDEFWSGGKLPGQSSVKEFINLLESTIQGRGTLSKRCYKNAGEAGILWPAQFGKTFGLSDILHPIGHQREESTYLDHSLHLESQDA